MKKSKFKKWFEAQFGEKPKQNYNELIEKRVKLRKKLTEVQCQIEFMEYYMNCERVANYTRLAASKSFKI